MDGQILPTKNEMVPPFFLMDQFFAVLREVSGLKPEFWKG